MCYFHYFMREVLYVDDPRDIGITPIDYSDLISGDPIRQTGAIDAYGCSMSTTGFGLILNTRTESFLDDETTAMRAFNELPEGDKMRFGDPALYNIRGYCPPGIETQDIGEEAEKKRFYDTGPEHRRGLPAVLRELYPVNIWPDEERFPQLGGFRRATLNSTAALEFIGKVLYEALGKYEGSGIMSIGDLEHGNHVKRQLWYGPGDSSHAHRDSNILTVLPEPDSSLEVLIGDDQDPRTGQWVSFPAPEGARGYVCTNTGEMTTFRVPGFPSAWHRVRKQGKSTHPRTTQPIFLHPRVNLQVHSSFDREDGEGPRPILGSEYLNHLFGKNSATQPYDPTILAAAVAWLNAQEAA